MKKLFYVLIFLVTLFSWIQYLGYFSKENSSIDLAKNLIKQRYHQTLTHQKTPDQIEMYPLDVLDIKLDLDSGEALGPGVVLVLEDSNLLISDPLNRRITFVDQDKVHTIDLAKDLFLKSVYSHPLSNELYYISLESDKLFLVQITVDGEEESRVQIQNTSNEFLYHAGSYALTAYKEGFLLHNHHEVYSLDKLGQAERLHGLPLGQDNQFVSLIIENEKYFFVNVSDDGDLLDRFEIEGLNAENDNFAKITFNEQNKEVIFQFESSVESKPEESKVSYKFVLYDRFSFKQNRLDHNHESEAAIDQDITLNNKTVVFSSVKNNNLVLHHKTL
jgi:hypothetical protein